MAEERTVTAGRDSASFKFGLSHWQLASGLALTWSSRRGGGGASAHWALGRKADCLIRAWESTSQRFSTLWWGALLDKESASLRLSPPTIGMARSRCRSCVPSELTRKGTWCTDWLWAGRERGTAAKCLYLWYPSIGQPRLFRVRLTGNHFEGLWPTVSAALPARRSIASKPDCTAVAARWPSESIL